MKRSIKLILVIASLSTALNGCQVNRVSPPVSHAPGSVAISTSMEAAQATASVLQTRDFLITSTNLYKNLGDIALNIMATDPTVVGATINCTDGGTYQYTGTASAGTYNLSITFNGCREERFQYEGSYTVTGGTPTNFTVSLGGASTFNIFYFNSDYNVLIDYLKAQMSFTMTGSGTATDASYTITPSGTITLFDYFLLDTFTIHYLQLSLVYTLSTDAVTSDRTITISGQGSFTNDSITRSLSIALTGFTVDRTEHYDSGTGTYTSADTSINGTALFDYRPNTYCFEGTYAVTTATPVHTDYVSGSTSMGTITLNTTATAQYNSGGDIDVSVTGDAPLNYTDEFELMKVCAFAAMEENTPPLLGSTGTALGSTMAVTLTWVDNVGSTSDMDLHVKYFNQTVVSSPTTTETWHIDWHQGKSCTDPSGLAFSDGLDTDNSGICDVGLDFDDTDGYGPEHITALKLPVGYYIISVDSFSLSDPPATLYLAVHIGDNIFGPFIGSLMTSDGEGEDPAAWYRVADVRVNGDGTVDVLAPDLTLTPWH